MQALAHLGAAVVDRDAAILIDADQRAALVEHGRREGDTEFQRADGEAALARAACGIEGIGCDAARAVIRCRLQLIKDAVADPVFDDLAVRRGHRQRVAAHCGAAVEIDAAHIQRVELQLLGDAFDHRLDGEHALRPAEAAEGRGRLRVRLAAVAHHFELRQVVAVVDVQHGAVVHRAGEVDAVAAARSHRHLQTEDAPACIETGLVVEAEIVPLAGDHHVVVAVRAQLDGAAELVRRERRALAEDAGVAFLAAEAAAHTPADDFDVAGAQVQGRCGLALVAVRVLRRDVERELAVLARDGVGDLAFEIELFLLAALRAPADTVRRARDGCSRVATRQAFHRQHESARSHGLVDGDDGRQLVHQHARLLRRFTRVEHLARHHQGHGLAKELDLAGSEEGVVVDDRAAVVFARDVTRREDRDDTMLREQGRAVDAFADELAMRHGRGDERAVQRAAQLGHVVGVDGLATDVQAR